MACECGGEVMGHPQTTQYGPSIVRGARGAIQFRKKVKFWVFYGFSHWKWMILFISRGAIPTILIYPLVAPLKTSRIIKLVRALFWINLMDLKHRKALNNVKVYLKY